MNNKQELEAQVVRPTRRVAGLLGFLLKYEADAKFRGQPSETDDVNPLELWREYDKRRQGLPVLPSGVMEGLPKELDDTIQRIRMGNTYKKHYEAFADFMFRLAPIESLISPQWYVDLDYVNELGQQVQPGMTLERQLLFAMSESKITEPIFNGKQIVFTSPRRDLDADQIPEIRAVEGGEFEIVVRASGRPNYIQVVQLGNQWILTNGVHKVCALFMAGFRSVPCLLRVVNTFEEMGLEQWGWFRPQTIGIARQAAVTDFLGPDTAIELRRRSTYQTLFITINVVRLDVPAL
jgi:hypothetical protein